jgi:hypothetical protein
MYIQCSYVLVELLVQYNYRILEHVQYSHMITRLGWRVKACRHVPATPGGERC